MSEETKPKTQKKKRTADERILGMAEVQGRKVERAHERVHKAKAEFEAACSQLQAEQAAHERLLAAAGSAAPVQPTPAANMERPAPGTFPAPAQPARS